MNNKEIGRRKITVAVTKVYEFSPEEVEEFEEKLKREEGFITVSDRTLLMKAEREGIEKFAADIKQLNSTLNEDFVSAEATFFRVEYSDSF